MGRVGLEPTTLGLGSRCSIHLSYLPKKGPRFVCIRSASGARGPCIRALVSPLRCWAQSPSVPLLRPNHYSGASMNRRMS